jgi:hypothetical protein
MIASALACPVSPSKLSKQPKASGIPEKDRWKTADPKRGMEDLCLFLKEEPPSRREIGAAPTMP